MYFWFVGGTVPVMRDLLKSLSSAAPQWKLIAIYLGLESAQVRSIDKDFDTIEDKLLEVLGWWEENVEEDQHNWKTIYEAMKNTFRGENKIVKQIRLKYLDF